MTSRSRGLVSWGLFGAALALLGVSVFLWIVNARHVSGVFSPQVLVVPTYGAVGAVIVAKRGHIVGWLLLTFSLVGAVTSISFEYSVASFGGFVEGLPKITVLAWLQQLLWPLNFVFLGLLLLLFPDGKTASPWFRKVLILLISFWGLAVFGSAISPAPIELLNGSEAISLPNPFLIRLPSSLYDTAMTVIFMGAMASILLAAVSPIVKWRRGSDVTKEQIRWPASVVAVSLLSVILAVALAETGVLAADSVLSMIPLLGAAVGLPVAIGISILRYRLYEIDRIVNRAVVYGASTAVLAATYVVVVFGLRGLLGGFAGSSDVAVAGSTLAVAALFRPVRNRSQSFIDRRFNRRRFDVQQTLEGFSASLRDQVDLDALTTQLTSVISQTMEPAHVSLWLRDTGPAEAPRS